MAGDQSGTTPLDPDEKEGLKAEASTREELNKLEQASVGEGKRWLTRRRQ